MRTDDILQIEQLYYFYELSLATGGYKDLPKLFSHTDDASFLILRVGEPIIGHKYIKQNFDNYLEGAPRYDTWHTGAQICTPLITVSEDGLSAKGMFPTSGYFIYCQEYDETPFPPYKVDATFEMWFDEFVKEDGVWKIKKFHFISMMANPIWVWNPDNDCDGYAARCNFDSLGKTPFDLSLYEREAKRNDKQ